MKIIVSLVFLLLSLDAIGGVCDKTDYAELKDMKKPELQAKYCELKHHQDRNSKNAEKVNSDVSRTLAYMDYALQCGEEAVRVAQLFERTYSSKPAECTPE